MIIPPDKIPDFTLEFEELLNFEVQLELSLIPLSALSGDIEYGIVDKVWFMLEDVKLEG